MAQLHTVTPLCDARTSGLCIDPQGATSRGSSCGVGRSTQVDSNSKLHIRVVFLKYVCSPTLLDQSLARALGLTACRKIRNRSAPRALGGVRLVKRWEYRDEW